MDSRSLRSLKSAIALSNMGTKLLERRRPCSALSTIKDALFLIRTCLTESTPSDELDRRTSEALLRASKAVAQSYIHEPYIPYVFSSTTPTVHVLSDSESPVIAIAASSQGISTFYQKDGAHSPLYAFHIDDRCYTEESVDTLDFEAATILFNLASALRSLPVTDLPSVKQLPKKHLHEAFQLLELAYTILGRRFADKRACWNDESQTSRLLVLSMMVVQSLVSLCPDLGVPPVKQGNLVHQLRQIYHTYATLVKRSPWWRDQQYNSAPAA